MFIKKVGHFQNKYLSNNMKKIFTKNKNVNVTAYMNWRIDRDCHILNTLNIADGYMSSGIILAKDSVNDNIHKKADIVIFPILANVNHGIELYLKATIATLNKLLKNNYNIDGGHDIKKLLETTQQRILKYKGGKCLNNFKDTNNSLIEYIKELFELIDNGSNKDNMDFSRYSVAKNGNNHFYVEEFNNVEVDLPNFVQRFIDIHENLINISDYFYHKELREDW